MSDWKQEVFGDSSGHSAPPDDDWRAEVLGDEGIPVDTEGRELAHAVSPPAVPAAPDTHGGWGDFAAGSLNGLLMNWGDEIGRGGEMIGNILSGAPAHAPGVNPLADASRTTMGQRGELAGNVVSGVAQGLATGGGSLARDVAIAAASNALSGMGARSDGDKMNLGRTAIDAAIGSAGGAVAHGVGRLLSGPTASAVAGPKPLADSWDSILSDLEMAKSQPSRAAVNPGAYPVEPEIGRYIGADDSQPIGAADQMSSAPAQSPPGMRRAPSEVEPLALDQSIDDPMEVYSSGRIGSSGSGREVSTPGAMGLSESDLEILKDVGAAMLPGGGKARAGYKVLKRMMSTDPGDWQGTPGVMKASQAIMSPVTRQESTAFARPDIPTLTWALQSLNTRGSGLPPDAQERFNRVMMSGDDQAISAEYMKNSMKYPEFQRGIEEELKSVSGG